MSSLLGLGGVFGTSLKTHLISWNGSSKKEISSDKNNSPKSFINSSREVEIKKVEKKKREASSINKGYFGSWRFQSEGSSKPVYLITADNQIKRIDPKSHGQKIRRLVDGIFIDASNPWFGKRSVFIKDRHSKNLSIKEIVDNHKKALSKNDLEEMRLLSEYWKKLDDQIKCDLFDIFVDCSTIKSKIGQDPSLEINNIIEVSLDKLISTFRNSDKLPKIKEFIGRGKFINLPKLLWQMSLFTGEPVDRWINEFVDDTESEKLGEANPIKVLRTLIKGEKGFYNCEKKELNEDIFYECNIDLSNKDNGESFNNEKWLFPTVIGVLKGGIKNGANELKIAVDKVDNAKSQFSAWNNEFTIKKDDKWSEEIKQSFKDKGRYEGLIDVGCDYLNNSWLALITKDPKSRTCEGIWQLVIPNNFVREKRWCLFKLPEGRDYLREYKLEPFIFSQWFKGDTFWAKCSSYQIRKH